MTFRKQIVFFAGGLALAAAVGLIPRQAGSLPVEPDPSDARVCVLGCETTGTATTGL